jgi:exo-1,4-beta-D-glucosaminidase
VTQTSGKDKGEDFCLFHIKLSNTNPTNIAFFVHTEVIAGKQGDEVAPIDYSDNYISLWPGEVKKILVKCSPSQFHGQSPFVRIKGYNVPEFFVQP